MIFKEDRLVWFYKVFILFIAIFSVAQSYAQVYKWKDENGKTHYSDKPHQSAKTIQIQGSKKHSNKSTSTQVVGKVKSKNFHIRKIVYNSKILKIRSLLKQKKFKPLNEYFEKLEKDSKREISKEQALFSAYKAFAINSKSYLPLLDSWAKATPDSYIPYLARATYNYHMGWFARGGKWSSETKEKQFEKMKIYLAKATEDVASSLDINSKSVVSFTLLAAISLTEGSRENVERFMRKALKISPASLYIRVSHLNAISPKWGGSMEEMLVYVIESLNYLKDNPRLKLLQGFVSTYAGDMRYISKAYSVSESLYTESLTHGEYDDVLFKRGKVRNRQLKYASAIKDLSRAIELNPEVADYYYYRAGSLMELEKYDDALKDIQFAYKLDPYDKYIKLRRKNLANRLESQGYESNKNQEGKSAIEKFNAALELDPDNSELYYRRARSHIHERDLKSALEDMKIAIDISPDEYVYVKYIDYILAKNRDWNQIIGYWDNYIELKPKDGRAFVERGGAYYHKGDIKSAVKNAKISAKLGNLDGIEAYNKFKHMIKNNN